MKKDYCYGFTYYNPTVWTNLISKGLLVTTPSPLGKKSNPTTASSKELFPLDWDPKTAILGKLICSYKIIIIKWTFIAFDTLKTNISKLINDTDQLS